MGDRTLSRTPWTWCGAFVLACATPIREEPPSKLDETIDGGTSATSGEGSDGGSGGSGDAGTLSASTGTSSSAADASASQSSSASTSGNTATSTSDGNGGDGSSTEGDDTSDDSDTSDTSSGGSAAGGTGGTGGTDGTTASTPAASTTGGTVITGELPWFDDFESYTPNAPADPNWTALESAGDWRVASDGSTQLYAPLGEASNRNMTYAGDVAWSNVRLEVDLRLGAGGDDATRIYLAVRTALNGEKLDYYHAYLRGDGRVRLGKYVDGSTDETFSESIDTGVGLDADTWHTFALTVVGDTLTAELDGNEVDSVSTTGLSEGFIALGIDGGTAEFDNVRVTEP